MAGAGSEKQAGGDGEKQPGGGLTGNALFTGVICAVIAAVVSFFIAHWQSQDAARQAVAEQQEQEVIQLRTDAMAYDQAALIAFESGSRCAGKVASACKKADASYAIGSPLVIAQDALVADVDGISDAEARTDATSFVVKVTEALAEDETKQGTAAWDTASRAYSRLLSRCGQIIQGG
jgi:hypothetical protein